MSNSRAMRRRIARVYRPRPRFPEKPPALNTTRRWIKQGEADGLIEQNGVERTGKPGRPAKLYRLTEEGKKKAAEETPPSIKDMLTELQARRAHALMGKGMSESRAIAAVTRGWRKPRRAAS